MLVRGLHQKVDLIEMKTDYKNLKLKKCAIEPLTLCSVQGYIYLRSSFNPTGDILAAGSRSDDTSTPLARPTPAR